MGRAGGDREHGGLKGNEAIERTRRELSTSRRILGVVEWPSPLSRELRGGQRPSERLLSPPVRPPEEIAEEGRSV